MPLSNRVAMRRDAEMPWQVDSRLLRALRQARRWSVIDVARSVGISPSRLYALESERQPSPRARSFGTVARLAALFEVPPAELICGPRPFPAWLTRLLVESTPTAPPSPFVVLDGDRLRVLRQRAGLTMAQLAERSGLRPSSVLKIEHACEPVFRATLLQLAEALKVPPGWLEPGPAPLDVEASPVPGDWIRAIEAARRLGVSRQRVLQLVDRGELQVRRTDDRRCLIEVASLERYQAQRKRQRPER